ARAAPRAQEDDGARGVAAGHDSDRGEVGGGGGERGSEQEGEHAPDYSGPPGAACYSPRAPKPTARRDHVELPLPPPRVRSAGPPPARADTALLPAALDRAH